MPRASHICTVVAFVQMFIGAAVLVGGIVCSMGCGNDKPADDPSTANAANAANAANGADAGLEGLTTESAAETARETAKAAKAPEMTLQALGTQTGDAVESGLRLAASKGAAGMTPDGPIGRADLKQGGHATMNVTLKAGRCYSVVGFGSGVTDLDIHVLTPPNYDVVAYEDSTDDNAPMAGKAPHPICPATAVELPYRVDAFAESGSGSIGVQLYSKAP